MRTTPLTMEELRQYKPQILEIASGYGIENIRVFGSVARGEARVDSDVDLMVDLGKPIGLKFFTFSRDIEGLLGCPADVGVDGTLKKYIEPYVMKDLKPL